MRAAGLMSGTSLDGIDVAYLDIVPRGRGYAIELVRFATVPFAAELSRRLHAALPPGAPALAEIAALDAELGAAFGTALQTVVRDDALDFAGSHGLTLFHDGARRRSWQIGDAFALRERAGVTVAFDFRRADCAAGGHGAPLVPYVDALLFGDGAETTVALNLGGIANVTLLPPGAAAADVRGWDTGPANVLSTPSCARAAPARRSSTRMEGSRCAGALPRTFWTRCSPIRISSKRRRSRRAGSASA